MAESSFSRSLLKIGGGMLQVSSQSTQKSQKGRRPKSNTQSGELTREDLEWLPSKEGKSDEREENKEDTLRTFLRWKEFTRKRREAWDTLSEDFQELRDTYERLQKEHEFLLGKHRVADVFQAWKKATICTIRDWRRGKFVCCWRVLRRWRIFTQKRTIVYRRFAPFALAVRKRTQMLLISQWRSRLKQKLSLRVLINRYQIGFLARFSFDRLKQNLERQQVAASVKQRLLRKALTRCVRKSFNGWSQVHRSRKLAVSLIARLSDETDARVRRLAYSRWLLIMAQRRKLQRLLSTFYRSHLSEGFQRISEASLQRVYARLRRQLVDLPSDLEAQFVSSCEDRLRQMSAALEHDKQMFLKEKLGIEQRARRMHSIVSSQASRIYGELQTEIDASSIRKEESETRIQPDNR